jgi:hypothetical protein
VEGAVAEAIVGGGGALVDRVDKIDGEPLFNQGSYAINAIFEVGDDPQADEVGDVPKGTIGAVRARKLPGDALPRFDAKRDGMDFDRGIWSLWEPARKALTKGPCLLVEGRAS